MLKIRIKRVTYRIICSWKELIKNQIKSSNHWILNILYCSSLLKVLTLVARPVLEQLMLSQCLVLEPRPRHLFLYFFWNFWTLCLLSYQYSGYTSNLREHDLERMNVTLKCKNKQTKIFNKVKMTIFALIEHTNRTNRKFGRSVTITTNYISKVQRWGYFRHSDDLMLPISAFSKIFLHESNIVEPWSKLTNVLEFGKTAKKGSTRFSTSIFLLKKYF